MVLLAVLLEGIILPFAAITTPRSSGALGESFFLQTDTNVHFLGGYVATEVTDIYGRPCKINFN